MKKMNNKGFSLVELIVVVLIMAIIAVALAPQVMRWVENSRKSNDIEAYASLVNALQVAGTDEGVLSEVGTSTITVTFDKATGVSMTGNKLIAAVIRTLPELGTSAGALNSAGMKVQGDWSGTNCMDTDNKFKITVKKSADGSGLVVEQTFKPKKVFS